MKQEFQKLGILMHLKRGEFVYRQGDSARGLYFIESGLVGLVITGQQSGHEHLLRFFKKDQFFGHRSLFSNESYHGSTVTLEPTTLYFVDKKSALEVFEKKPELMREILNVISQELRRVENHQVMILENEILVRVAQSLIYLKELHPDHNWTRQEIANFCASTVSTVIKALSELERLGLIVQKGRAIEILNRDAILELQDSH